jgi:hypothetical protein
MELSAPSSKKNDLDSFEKDHEIQKNGKILDVVKIVFKFLDGIIDGCSIAVADLCPTGKTWLGDMSL